MTWVGYGQSKPAIASSPAPAPTPVVPAPQPSIPTPPTPAPTLVARKDDTAPEAPTGVIANTADMALHKYNKYIIGAASVGAFGSMIYTIRQRTKGKMKMPLAELLENPQAAAANPKLTAYIFAGRAFTTATLLVLTGTLGLGMGVASIMGVNNLREFSVKMRQYASTAFPKLRGAPEDHDSKFDQDTYDFLKEVSADAEREEREGEWTENHSHAIIGGRVRGAMGHMYRGDKPVYGPRLT
ncbi:hypothetical protein HK097_004770 [Rhizophlyctis rosea]|uniref:Transmembrane protein 242 n=1 Tax=Rhizophlyctis rosea TaxID=64517 RepID=A0AAD5X6D0_9FUNG|nr:hypothetical protein HK097_004770 [Rhizophlyctis rosea]